MKKICTIILLIASVYTQAQVSSGSQLAPPKSKMTPLFNGKDLNGWYSFLASKGKNNDPEKVFAIEDGLLHISGKEFGYISTEKLYKDFHLVAEFKWGTKKYPPRDADTIKRDNGICFYFPAEEKDKVWPMSVECQIQEGDVGDIWLIGGATVMVDGQRTVPKDYLRVQKKADGEKPNGEWNRVEVVADKGNITYWVNVAPNPLGEAYLAAHIIAVRFEAFTYLPAVAWGAAVATMIGQSLGAGDIRRAIRTGNEGVLQCGALAAVLGLIYFFAAPQIYRLMSTDPLVREVGTRPFRFLALLQPLLATSIVYIAALRGAGDTRYPLLISLMGAFCVRVPLGYFFGIVLNGGLMGAWVGMFGDMIWRAVGAIIRYHRGRWVHTKV